MFGDAAGDEDRDAVADHLQLAEQVAVDEDGLALAAEALEDVADVAAADGVDAVGRLVEQDEVRVVDQGLGEADALGHALGVGGDRAVGAGGHADEVEQFGGAAAAVAAVDVGEGGEELDDLPAGQVAGEAVVLGEVAGAGEGGLVADGLGRGRCRRSGWVGRWSS